MVIVIIYNIYIYIYIKETLNKSFFLTQISEITNKIPNYKSLHEISLIAT